MRRWLSHLFITALAAAAISGCRHEERTVNRSLGFDEFVPNYNRYIRNWLASQKEASLKKEAELTTAIQTATGEQKPLLESQLEAVRSDLVKWEFRNSLGDYLKIGTPAEVPADLVWENGMDQPEIGDPRAIKGGVFRKDIPTFPPTLRQFGDNTNNGFRGDIYDNIDMKLAMPHPETMKLVPGVANEWAVSKDGRTVYFHIDPAARYSNGEVVTAIDYLITPYLNVSDNVTNPYQKQYYREEIAQIAMYDDHTISVSLPEARVYGPLTAAELTPSPQKFFAEYGPDYNERYQWKFRPTTGAYEIRPEGVIRGSSITQSRVKDWWAKDRKFYRYRFNADKIVHTVVRDDSKIFELFRAGELDTALLTRPQNWYEKSEMPPVFDGYIDRVTFYKRYPKLPLGLYLNVRKPPLDNRDVRIGINFAMNWQKVIEVVYRGDYQRLNMFNEGNPGIPDAKITARAYSVSDARKSFAAAGYTEEDRDGILKKPDGTRLEASVTYPAIPALDRIFSILREEAKACGFDLKLDGSEATVAYKKEMQKQHQIAFGSWLVEPPMPDFHQFLHSTNAVDEKGNLKPQTNNTFAWARPDTDRLSTQVRTARTMEELASACQQLQQIVHDEGIFVPGYTVDFIRIGSWRWVKWPDCETTRFSPPVVYDPHDEFVYWIDEKVQEETQSARRTGRTFPESTRVVDAYREAAPANSSPTPP